MAQTDHDARPQFSQPIRQILMMLIVIGLSGFGVFVALPRVMPVFEANPYLNGFILLVFVIGVVACFWQVVQLIGSVRWIEEFAAGYEREGSSAPQLLAPLDDVFQPVVSRKDQAVWNDPEHDFCRRSVSPSNGPLAIELIEGQLGKDQLITYAAPAIPGQEHHVYVLSGGMEITVEDVAHDLKAGDCLRYILFGETVFRTTSSPCQYVIALS